jgi:pimeloyl-ACP methyl ester carboxylesterase
MLQDDTFRDLERITAETLILWGDRDAICSRADQAALAACIARSRMTIYQGAGHAPHWEEPARVAADLVTFTQEQLLAAA